MASLHVQTIKFQDGREVCLLYGVIVAAFIPGRGMIKTRARYSNTTTRYMNQFAGKNAPEIDHAELLALCAPVASKQ